MLTRRMFNRIAAVAPLSLGLPSSARAQARLTIPIATWGSPTHINIVEFVGPLEAFLKQKSQGQLAVQHFPAGQLANDADMAVAVSTGKVKLGWSTLALWSGIIPDARVADAPTGLTMQQFAAATDGADGIKAVLDKQMQAKGAKLLAVTDLGPVVIVSNKKVLTPADLKGVRIRVFSEGTASLFRELGAAPLQIPFGDVYTSLQKGTIDAALIGLQGVQSQRMYEIAKFLVIPASFVGTGLQGYVGNLAWWNGLAEADRKIVGEGIGVAEAHCRSKIIDDRQKLAADYRGRGMTVTSLEASMPEYKAWAAATAPVLAKAEQTLSKEIMAPVRRLLGR
ncbi:MAG: TRAP transporter substrate-binding protein [Hyphomicrobiaceae bacterium]|nr:MAG: TRAP transporter substrate-binding protein [Hyphomicrobiaceae bacterium]